MYKRLTRSVCSKIINSLFNTAGKKGLLDYLYLLLRVSGVAYKEDDFIILEKKLASWDIATMDKKILIENCRIVTEDFVSFRFIMNLLRCSAGENYLPFPFETLNVGVYPDVKAPGIDEVLRYMSEYCVRTSNDDLRDILEKILFGLKNVKSGKFVNRELRQSLEYYKRFFLEFVRIYGDVLKSFSSFKYSPKRWFKIKPFTVAEILADDNGLFGIKLYSSNGSMAFYERRPGSATGLNLGSEINGVSLFVGDIGQLKHEYMVLDKPLYEIGLFGRYNNYGEWKPIEYEGSSDLLEARLKIFLEKEKEKSDFYDLYGVFQYIMATGYHAIEFIVKANIEFPYELNRFNVGPNHFEMSLVEFGDSTSNSFKNMFVYDCSILLSDISIDNVRFALESINTIFSRIAFQVDSWYQVINKYPGSSSQHGSISLNKDTINLINYFSRFSSEDSSYFDLAIEWYVDGNNSENLFHRYLSYCISLESLAIPFTDGKLKVSKDFDISVVESTKAEKKLCVEDVRDREKSLLGFIEKSYLECLHPSLAKKIGCAIENVFGSGSLELKEFFKKVKYNDERGSFTLYDIRSSLAHGDFSYNNRDDVNFVSKRTVDISILTKKFIMALLSKNSDKSINIKIGKNGRSVYFLTSDPRTTGITSSLNIIPNKNWKISRDLLF